MAGYKTFDNFPDLTPAQMAGARDLSFSRNTNSSYSWENEAYFYSSENYALLKDTFQFNGIAGATYDVVSSSFFDPFILLVYDNLGNVIATDDGRMSYGYDHASFQAPYTGAYYISASWDQGLASGHKGVTVSVYEELGTVAKNNVVNGTAGQDRILGTHENDVVDGGAGIDTFVVGRQREMYNVAKVGGVITVRDVEGLSGTDTLTNVERIQFFGGNYLSYETEGVPAQAYRLYQAAFDRTPDKGGLGYWIGQMSQGATLESVAGSFADSVEFKKLYGIEASNTDILTRIYANVLDRTPDKAGFEFWLNALDSKSLTIAQVLMQFSESPENQVQVVGSLQVGYEFTVT